MRCLSLGVALAQARVTRHSRTGPGIIARPAHYTQPGLRHSDCGDPAARVPRLRAGPRLLRAGPRDPGTESAASY